VKSHRTRRESTTQAPVRAKRHHTNAVFLVRCALCACMVLCAGAAFGVNAQTLDIAVRSLAAAQAPRMVGDVLLLTLKPNVQTRFVGARFAHESWKVLHPYTVNENGVFVLDYAVPEGIQEIRYKIVVDGLWMADPTNPTVETDELGNEFSVFTLEKEPVRLIFNPRREPGGGITFIFRGTPGRRVCIAGDFNFWDPFVDTLAETSPGTYRITLRVPAGDHWYYFFTDGRRQLDRLNPETGVDPDGNIVSYFSSP
jgi:Glycogen recognition site of AMP-activated protein kinase